MDIAEDRDTRQDRAYAVEQCACPQGYKGLSCEVCHHNRNIFFLNASKKQENLC